MRALRRFRQQEATTAFTKMRWEQGMPGTSDSVNSEGHAPKRSQALAEEGAWRQERQAAAEKGLAATGGGRRRVTFKTGKKAPEADKQKTREEAKKQSEPVTSIVSQQRWR